MKEKRNDLPKEEIISGELFEMTDEKSRMNTKNLEESEIKWYKEVYKGDSMKQLTVRAVVMGAFLGGFMSLSNLYVGLKTGWGLGVAITACILSYSIWKILMFLPFFPKDEMTILENNCMQSTASSAGYSTGGTMVSAISAYLIITGAHMSWLVLTLWTIFLAALGVFIAIPMKRQMINVEQLRFPSGIAAAETLKSLHSQGGEASDKARALGISALFGAVIALLRDGNEGRGISLRIKEYFSVNFSIPGMLPFNGRLMGQPFEKWTFSFEMSAIMIAAGAIIGWKVAWSMLFGAAINYGVLAPWMVQAGAIDASKLGYRAIVQWSTWAGASIMVTSGLFMFALQWKTIARAFGGMTQVFSKNKEKEDYVSKIEVPSSWFLTGTFFAGLGCIMVLHYAFNTSWWMGCVAVVLTFFLAIVAARATGESDITPIGAMGKITQLTFGVLAPSNMVTNLMTASVTAGAAGSSADLLTDLKSGYLLGANPRQQFIAQFLGIFAGTIIVVPAFYLLVPDASLLGSDKWPAPSAQVWAAVAKLLSNGVHSLHPTAKLGLLIGGLLGVIIPSLELIFPKHRKYIPSAMGLGLSMVIPFWNSLSMFLGGFIAFMLQKASPKVSDKYLIPVSAGIIAGESIMGVTIALAGAREMLSEVYNRILAVMSYGK
ncbi:MAG: peptide transporter [Elusimicrobia bacterium CG08_land_8_20_14_0_20_51_18]|nr:MAG: peptide transporter [Elusimicrobia bacterium CG08_land_8_20_14_0_20_51_18]